MPNKNEFYIYTLNKLDKLINLTKEEIIILLNQFKVLVEVSFDDEYNFEYEHKDWSLIKIKEKSFNNLNRA